MLPFALILMRFFFRYMPPLFILSPRHPSYSSLPAKGLQAINHPPHPPPGAPQKNHPPGRRNRHGDKCRSVSEGKSTLRPSTRHISPQNPGPDKCCFTLFRNTYPYRGWIPKTSNTKRDVRGSPGSMISG